MKYRYTLSRNVEATREDGSKAMICLASVIHENGVGETVAINEDLIAFEGEWIIPQEIAKAMER